MTSLVPGDRPSCTINGGLFVIVKLAIRAIRKVGHMNNLSMVSPSYLGVFHIVIVQYKLRREEFDLGRAGSLMREVLELDKVYFGTESPATRESQRIYKDLQ